MAYWYQEAASFGGPHRDSAQTFLWKGRQFIHHGYQPGGVNLKDIFRSDNGRNYVQHTATTPYAAYAAVGPFGADLYAMDVDPGDPTKSLLHTSSDGITWNLVTGITGDIPPFIVEELLHQHGEYLFVTMRLTAKLYRFHVPTKVWTEFACEWSPRSASFTAYARGRLFLMMGAHDIANTPIELGYANRTSLCDMWSVDLNDPSAGWTCEARDGPTARMWPAACYFDGDLYMVGGYSNLLGLPNNFGDTWCWSLTKHKWERRWMTTVSGNLDLIGVHAPVLYHNNGVLRCVTGNTNTGTSTQKFVQRLWTEPRPF